jgi:deoxyribodipyrimidine photo-lyase
MSTALVWFRQDLRCSDNPAFAAACNHHQFVVPLYIQDNQTLLLGEAQKWWIHHSLLALKQKLRQHGLTLVLRRGVATEIITQLVREHSIDAVYWNRCYEPAAIACDFMIKESLEKKEIQVFTSNASLLNEPWEIKNKSGDYYKVFTPYWKHCLKQHHHEQPICIQGNPHGVDVYGDQLSDWFLLPKKINWAAEFGQHWQPGEDGAQMRLDAFISDRLRGYKEARNVPAKSATSTLSPHLHFGEISPWKIRTAIDFAMLDKNGDLASADRFLSEIGWREFSYHLLYHFPALPYANFKPQFDAFPWKNDAQHIESWKRGLTGYPIVDAGMRELWRTGYMHNRVRMIVASFLTKHLLVDWRIGADWFLTTLLDADLANNSASWQWVAGSGADAAPYFRIFNPIIQSEKFDPTGEYIRRWVPELANIASKWIHQPSRAPKDELGLIIGRDYPTPIVEHEQARKLALMQYRLIRNKTQAV